MNQTNINKTHKQQTHHERTNKQTNSQHEGSCWHGLPDPSNFSCRRAEQMQYSCFLRKLFQATSQTDSPRVALENKEKPICLEFTGTSSIEKLDERTSISYENFKLFVKRSCDRAPSRGDSKHSWTTSLRRILPASGHR